MFTMKETQKVYVDTTTIRRIQFVSNLTLKLNIENNFCTIKITHKSLLFKMFEITTKYNMSHLILVLREVKKAAKSSNYIEKDFLSFLIERTGHMKYNLLIVKFVVLGSAFQNSETVWMDGWNYKQYSD